MEARRNPDGTVTVPMPARGPDGVMGDGVVTIGPDHPDFKAWDEWLKLREGEGG